MAAILLSSGGGGGGGEGELNDSKPISAGNKLRLIQLRQIYDMRHTLVGVTTSSSST